MNLDNYLYTYMQILLYELSRHINFNHRQHVVALIDPEMCINCGKCYMTCNDTGYQVNFVYLLAVLVQ